MRSEEPFSFQEQYRAWHSIARDMTFTLVEAMPDYKYDGDNRALAEAAAKRLHKHKCDHPNPVTDTSVEWCPACGSVVQIKSEVVSAKVLHRQRDTISKLVGERDELKKMLREVAEKIDNARLLEREDHD